MSYDSAVPFFTWPSSTGLQSLQFVAISTATGKLIDPTTDGRAIGVLISSGTTANTRVTSQTVQYAGISKVRSGSTAINPGDRVKAGTAGLAAPVTSSTSWNSGVSLGTAASTYDDGTEIINILLFPFSGSIT